MLVATQYESIDEIELKLKDYVKSNIDAQENCDITVDDYSLEDSRMELSPSVKTIVYNNNAVLGNSEIYVSELVIPDIKQSILDMLPMQLRQEFLYENRVTDSNRTLLLQKNLTLVTLIQDIQDELQKQDIDDDLENEFVDTVEDTIDTEEIKDIDLGLETQMDIFSEDSDSTSTLEIADLDEFDLGNSVEETDEFTLEDNTEEIDEFTLEDNTEEIDEFTLEDSTEETDEFTLEDSVAETDAFTLEDSVAETDEFTMEDATEETDEFTLEDNTEETDEFTMEDTTEETDEFTMEETTDELSEFTMENSNEQVETTIPNKQSDLDVFKSIMTSDSTPRKVDLKSKTRMDDNVELGLEDLESVSEDDIEDIADINSVSNTDIDLDDEDTEEIDTNTEDTDVVEDYVEDDDEDEDDEDEEEDTDLEDIEFLEDEEDTTTVVGTQDTEFIDKTEDNVEFLDESNVSMQKPNIDTNKVIPKSELGRVLSDKAKGTHAVTEKQTFMQGFDKNVETEKNKEEMVAEFKGRLNKEQTKPPERVQEKKVVREDDEPVQLPPLRNYLKKHPYTPIEDLINLGYSRTEIQDGVTRGKFVKKNGMLRALF